MERILKNINAVVGVTGCFVCNDKGEALAGALPAVFDEEMLLEVGRTAAQTVAGLTSVREKKVNDIILLYEEGRFIIKALQKGCLCILCVRRINVPLLNLTANIAVKKLNTKMKEKDKTAKPETPPPKVAEPKVVEPQAIEPQATESETTIPKAAEPETTPEAPSVVEDTVSASFFVSLEQELVRVMGPLGPAILDNEIAVQGEIRTSFPRRKAVGLIERLSNDIGDKNKRRLLRQNMLSVLENT